MAKRPNYPDPQCPKCGSKESKVLAARYTTDNIILRRRECLSCKYRAWTQQYPERFIDPADVQVRKYTSGPYANTSIVYLHFYETV